MAGESRRSSSGERLSSGTIRGDGTFAMATTRSGYGTWRCRISRPRVSEIYARAGGERRAAIAGSWRCAQSGTAHNPCTASTPSPDGSGDGQIEDARSDRDVPTLHTGARVLYITWTLAALSVQAKSGQWRLPAAVPGVRPAPGCSPGPAPAPHPAGDLNVHRRGRRGHTEGGITVTCRKTRLCGRCTC